MVGFGRLAARHDGDRADEGHQQEHAGDLDGANVVAAQAAWAQAAFEAERQRWVESGQLNFSASDESAAVVDEQAIPAGCVAIPSHIPGNIWKSLVEPGATVSEGQALVILESMKMEVTVVATRGGQIREIRCVEGRPVSAGEALIVIAG